MTDEQINNICPLFRGGSCPSAQYDGEYCEIPYSVLERDNEDCCNAHYHPNEEDIKEMFPK